MESLIVLGATGSIGTQTLDVVRRHPDSFRVRALTACGRWREMASLCREFAPDTVVMTDPDAAEALRNHLRETESDTQVLSGDAEVASVAGGAQGPTVVAGIVGAAGVRPTLAAVRAGKRILLANKEALVVTGRLFMEAVQAHGAILIPVDSEHNAIYQCLPEAVQRREQSLDEAGVGRLLLTASGGPFRQADPETLAAVTPEQAVCHPNWDMGPKISVDSATLMNKGLELIEACWLFQVAPERIEVVVHPQSVVHSMVEYADGSVLAQLGTPDMRTPLAHALGWPGRIAAGAERLDFTRLSGLVFEAPDEQRFPALRLARRALQLGGCAPAVLNAANEEAVAAFLDHRIGFMDIAGLAEAALTELTHPPLESLEQVLEVDAHARAFIRDRVEGDGSAC
jgi:1-deoxy-D-xylulose-5-phosphate reductoisomerase